MINNVKINFIDVCTFLIQNNIAYDAEENVVSVNKFASLKSIEDNCLYFFTGEELSEKVINSIVLVNLNFKGPARNNSLIKVNNPQLIFYKLMNEYCPKTANEISENALISKEADIGENVGVGHFTTIGNANIGDDVTIGNNVVIHDNVHIGHQVTISDNTVIGASGVAWIWDDVTKFRVMQPQIGGVCIGSKVFIGSNVTIVRGSVNENTNIHDGCLISHGSQVGHGVQIHENVHVANNCALAGNANIGSECFIGAGVTISSQISIASKVTIGAGAIVSKNIELEGAIYIGMPARAIPQQNNMNGVPKQK